MAKPERVRVVQPSSGVTMTKQSMKDEVNINSIIKRWHQGIPIPQNHRNPVYGDFSGLTDYHAEVERVRSAELEFMRLPSALRNECDHNVGVFLDKVKTEDGLKQMIELGLDGELAPPGIEAPKEREVEKPVEKELEPPA